MEPQRSLIAEIETAIADGSSAKRLDTLRRVTDLFLGGAEVFSDTQVDLFDDVISRLAERIETKARVELANRLAPVRNAPTTVVRALARDESIEVAAPVLTQSTRLTEEDLLACARGGSQDRLLAISRRAAVSEAVSDVLVTHGDRDVVRSVARNDGARFSHAGYSKLVEKSAHDDDLAVSVGQRKDISKEHFQALVSKASDAVFKKLAALNPAAVGEVKRALLEVTGVDAAAMPNVVRDYTQAKALFARLQRSGEPIEPAIHDFARAGKIEETIAALAALCRLPIEVVERIVVDKRAERDLILILAKAASLSWPTAKLILLMCRGEGGIAAQDIDMAGRHFDRLQLATAQRVVRFYQVRHAAVDKAH